MKAKILREKYPKFVYNSFDFKLKKKGLEICFDFKIEPDIQFSPKVLIGESMKKKSKE